MQWKIINDNRLIFRLSPKDLFKTNSEQSKIKRVIHLCSHTKSDFEIQSISEEELVRNALPILINELVLANNKLNTIASMSESIFPSSQEMYTKVRAIFNSAFHNVEIKLVLIPYMSNPNHLYEFLKKEGCLN